MPCTYFTLVWSVCYSAICGYSQFLSIQGEDEVRAPIPQKQEILVEGPDEIAYSFRGRRRIARSVFDKFRDFEAETSESLLAYFLLKQV